MSDTNYTNEEVQGNETNYDGLNYPGNQYAGDPMASGMYRTNYTQGQYPPPQGIFNQQAPQNANNYRPANYNPNNQRYGGQNARLNNRGYGRTYYPNNYQGDDMRAYPYPHPFHYHHEYGYHHGYRPYDGYNYNTYGVPYGYHHDHCCDQYQYMRPGSWMNWANPNVLSNFIQKPKVNNFLRGVGIAAVGLVLAPSVAKTLRPVIVKAVRGAMTASEEIKSIFSDAKEDIEDIFAEAKWDGVHPENSHPNGNGNPNSQ